MADATVPIIVVTGANGFVGACVCRALTDRGASVRAVVRRAGAAPALPDVAEHVGDFGDAAFAADVLDGADAAVTTVHPMGSDRRTQEAIGVQATRTFAAAAARDAGVERLVHVSTAAVYDRAPGTGDVDEDGALVGDDGGDYGATKRDADAALAEVDGITRVLVRPPAILGPGETSVWNALRPARMREDEADRRAVPDATFAWVHVEDLAALIADVSAGRIAATGDPGTGPVEGACTPVNVAAAPATQRDYYETVTSALGVAPVWDDGPGWTGRIVADRARAWGWAPQTTLDAALREVAAGLTS
jgi:nucleoside-diphosphate-sugar epimerase